MKNRKIIIGSRGSKLALIYAEKARENILKHAKSTRIDVFLKEQDKVVHFHRKIRAECI